jgi:hypothetical protein
MTEDRQGERRGETGRVSAGRKAFSLPYGCCRPRNFRVKVFTRFATRALSPPKLDTERIFSFLRQASAGPEERVVEC